MSLGTPTVNLHAPGPIGDTTPATLAGTTLAINNTMTIDASVTNYATVNVSPGGFNNFRIQFGGVDYYNFSAGGIRFPIRQNLLYSNSQANYTIYAVDDHDGSGIGNGGSANTATVVINGSDTVIVTASKMAMKSGVDIQLGNTATTGLTAGVLAALTNSSIVLKDSTGQSYRIPCII